MWHVRSFQVDSPSEALDLPFYTSCQEPKVDAPRSNATIVMLARNTDVDGAVIAVKSVEEHFNKWYHYPITFLNDKPWDPSFVNTLSKVASGETKFETIEQNMWGFPKWIDKKKASRKMRDQEAAGQMYAGKASYHHMCRFNSGFFYDHPALQKYKWFWRIEPDIRFTCDITYDPFIEMEKHKKKYGYTMALWEAGETVPSLYRKVSDWKEKRGVHDTLLWSAFLAPSTAPWPFRKFLSLLRNRNVDGDLWNMCHFWSNFEIADMDFFRSQEYRDFFDFLDLDGGFYYERVSLCPIHFQTRTFIFNWRMSCTFTDFSSGVMLQCTLWQLPFSCHLANSTTFPISDMLIRRFSIVLYERSVQATFLN